MGRILRKKRVGNEDSENLVSGKSDQLPLKSAKALSDGVKTGSSPKTLKRTVLMDKTNSLKPKGQAGRNAAQTKPGVDPDDAENSVKPVAGGGKVKRIARRRKSSKENHKDHKVSPEVEAKSRPLGDKTNVSVGRSASADGAEAEETNGVKLADNKQTSNESEGPEKILSAIAPRKLPPRNASKFEDGWISALRRSRSSKESVAEPLKTSPAKAESKSSEFSGDATAVVRPKRARRISKESDVEPQTSSPAKADTKSVQLPCVENAVENHKRGRRGKVANTAKELSPVVETKTRQSPRNKKNAVTASEETSAKKREHNKNSFELDSAGNVADVPPPSGTPLRKLPPRSAAKYEKGWISALRKQRTSKDKENPKKSPSSPKHLDEPAADIGKTDISKDEESGSESAEEQKVILSRRQSVRRKNRLDTKAQEVISIDSDCTKTLKSMAFESHRGVKSFESRMTAKLGKDMCGSVSVDKPKSPTKSPKKTPPTRALRKRGVKEKVPSPLKNTDFKKSSPCERIQPSAATEDHLGTAKTGLSLNEKDLRGGVEGPTHGNESHQKTANSHPSKASIYDPKPGCSRDSEFVTPLRKSASSKSPHGQKISPSAPPKAPSSSLFSIFKKPETPRRNSIENKIFVSATKPRSPGKPPVYGDPNMTPLKKTSTLPREMKEELYDFEVDENEPKPKKRHKPIMKIQRIRAVKRKKPKVYEADPETERRVLKNLDLSPSVFEEFRAAKKIKVASPAGVVAQMSQSAHPAEAADCADADDHHSDIDVEPMSSPCRDYGQSTPMRTDAPSMFMDDCRDKFGRISVKAYSPVKAKDSPVKAKDSPIPILMAEYNNDPIRRDDSSRRSVASNLSCASGASGNSIYHNDLDVSASTPVKFNKNYSCVYVRQKKKPVELNVSNCFGFDEPELMEEPLVSPIKSDLHVPANSARHAPTLISKPPVMLPPPETPAVDVDVVIKQLRFEVGDNASANSSANLSVYDDSEICLKSKSPIKRYFQPKNDELKARVADESSPGGEEPLSPTPAPPKVPRLSYERLNKLRKQRVILPVYKETESPDESEASDEDGPAEKTAEPVEQTFQPTKNKYVKKEAPKKKEKGMTKKEEEELEKWAQMFNSQCDQISTVDLVFE